jgi:hypothetical protein
MFTFTLESTHFVFDWCPIYSRGGAGAKFGADSQEADYRAYSFSSPLLSVIGWKRPTLYIVFAAAPCNHHIAASTADGKPITTRMPEIVETG